MTRCTINDVAEQAGVSVATVSRALRGLPNVSPVSRARVLAAAEALRYSTDRRASSLASGRTKIIAVATPHFGSWYVSETVVGVETALAAHGLDLLILSVPRGPDQHLHLADRLAGRRVDGLLLIDFSMEQAAREFLLETVQTPIVTTGERIAGLTSLAIDNETGGRMAAEHLLELGHRRIAFVGAPDPANNGAGADERRKLGASSALERHGLAFVADIDGLYSIEGGSRAFDKLAAMGDSGPTAVFCASDEMAVGLVARAREVGTAVPDKLSVIGFDDHEMAAPLGLSTIRQDVASNGSWAAELLLSQIDEPTDPIEHRPSLTLMHRSTTTAPSA